MIDKKNEYINKAKENENFIYKIQKEMTRKIKVEKPYNY